MNRTVIHVAAWVGYLLIYATLWKEPGEEFLTALLFQLWLLPVKLLLVYSTLGILVPKFLHKKKYVEFTLSVILLSLACGLLNQFYLFFIVPASQHAVGQSEYFWNFGNMSKRLTFLNSPLLFALAFEGLMMWYKQQELNAQLTKEKLTAELALLKNQLQPHFFFNTMNNLYSLTLQKSDLAPELILKLSDLMRYILYEAQRDEVPLNEEIKFIRSFLEIEKVRYFGRINISETWPVPVPDGIKVPPLILFTFIENAFKHGVAHELDRAWVDIKLDVSDRHIDYTVRNSRPSLKANGKTIATTGGIGLRNTGSRLKIAYGDRFMMNTDQASDYFSANLRIER